MYGSALTCLSVEPIESLDGFDIVRMTQNPSSFTEFRKETDILFRNIGSLTSAAVDVAGATPERGPTPGLEQFREVELPPPAASLSFLVRRRMF